MIWATRYERIFTLAEPSDHDTPWIRIEQEFLLWETGDTRDRVVRIRTTGPNCGLTEIRTWEQHDVRVKQTRTPVRTIEVPLRERLRSSRDSRIATWNGLNYTVDRYHGSQLPDLVTFTFDDLRNAADLDPPRWVDDDITCQYRILSRRFAR